MATTILLPTIALHTATTARNGLTVDSSSALARGSVASVPASAADLDSEADSVDAPALTDVLDLPVAREWEQVSEADQVAAASMEAALLTVVAADTAADTAKSRTS